MAGRHIFRRFIVSLITINARDRSVGVVARSVPRHAAAEAATIKSVRSAGFAGSGVIANSASASAVHTAAFPGSANTASRNNSAAARGDAGGPTITRCPAAINCAAIRFAGLYAALRSVSYLSASRSTVAGTRLAAGLAIVARAAAVVARWPGRDCARPVVESRPAARAGTTKMAWGRRNMMFPQTVFGNGQWPAIVHRSGLISF